LITSCHVSEKPKSGPETAHPTTITIAAKNANEWPAHLETREANRSKWCSRLPAIVGLLQLGGVVPVAMKVETCVVTFDPLGRRVAPGRSMLEGTEVRKRWHSDTNKAFRSAASRPVAGEVPPGRTRTIERVATTDAAPCSRSTTDPSDAGSTSRRRSTS